MLYTQIELKTILKNIKKQTIDISTEPVTNRPMRSAAKKERLPVKTCF